MERTQTKTRQLLRLGHTYLEVEGRRAKLVSGEDASTSGFSVELDLGKTLALKFSVRGKLYHDFVRAGPTDDVEFSQSALELSISRRLKSSE
ncbi:MAG TPA: hypothetical protein VL944_02630 [Candidatus Acidoferrum sp.]|nr:hypothetical protein [Candidatus Acidoferrum sp.]